MPLLKHSAQAKTTLSVAWEQFLLKARSPEKFVPGVTDVEILEEGPVNRIVRKMSISMPHGKITVVEEIVWDNENHTVDFRLLEHPTHTGNVLNIIEKRENGEIWITFIMDWKFKGEGNDPIPEDIIQRAVMNTVKEIEAAASKE